MTRLGRTIFHRAVVLALGLAAVFGSDVATAAVVVGADGKTTRVNPPSTPTPTTPPAVPVRPAAPMPGAPGSPFKRNRREQLGGGAAGASGAAAGNASGTGTNAAPSSGSTQLIGDKDFNTCKKFPPGRRIVKLNLKPDTELGDLISWISSITCKQFLLPGTIPGNSKKVTVVAPELITPRRRTACS